jgi:hypothetical protein
MTINRTAIDRVRKRAHISVSFPISDSVVIPVCRSPQYLQEGTTQRISMIAISGIAQRDTQDVANRSSMIAAGLCRIPVSKG